MTNLERWRYYLRDIESPDIYINWTFYYTVAAALQRRVWYGPKDFEIFPCLYIWFIGAPSLGKTMAAVRGLQLLESFVTVDEANNVKQTIPTAPDSATLEALTNYIADKCRNKFKDPSGKLHVHFSIAFVSEELGVLFKRDTDDLIMFLCQGYDARRYIRHTKGNGKDFIPNICVNFLAGTTPDWMAKPRVREMMGDGLASRVICVWAETPRFRKATIAIDNEQQQEYDKLKKHFEAVSKVCGEVKFSPEAEAFFVNWYEKEFDKARINKEPRLDYYYGRKKLHLRKMSIAFHFADNTGLEIGVESVQSALKFLNLTELNMHKAVAGAGRNPLHEHMLKIKEYLSKQNEAVTLRKLRLQFGCDLSMKEIDECLEFLLATGQVDPVADGLFRAARSSFVPQDA